VRKFAEYFTLSETRNIELSNSETIASALQWAPTNAYAFRTYELPDLADIAKSQRIVGNSIKVIAEREQLSGMYFIDGKVYTAEVAVEMAIYNPKLRTLADSIKDNDWTHVIRCRTGNWQVFNPATDTTLQSSEANK